MTVEDMLADMGARGIRWEVSHDGERYRASASKGNERITIFSDGWLKSLDDVVEKLWRWSGAEAAERVR